MELLVEEATRNQTPWNNTELDYTSDLGGFPKCHVNLSHAIKNKIWYFVVMVQSEAVPPPSQKTGS